MSVQSYTSDGDKLFYAGEYISTGFVGVLSSNSDAPGIWSAVYSPGVAGAVNVQPSPSNPDHMYFYGNMGTDTGLILHTVSTGANVDITPPSIGTDEIQTLAVNPSPLPDGNVELICRVEGTVRRVVYSSDNGATWTQWDNTIVQSGTWILGTWGVLYPNGFVVSTFGNLFYSPNEGASILQVGTSISSLDICGIEFSDVIT